MSSKKKKDVSDNSESDRNINSPPLKSFNHSVKSSSSKNSPKKKSASVSDHRCSDNNDLQRTEPGVEVLDNEFRSRNASNEFSDVEFRDTNSRNDKLDLVKSIFNIEELTSDDEIYTLQCPENYIKQNLCNKTIDFTKPKQAIAHNKEMYLVELLNCEKKSITLAIPKKISGGSLVKMPLKGHIVIQKVFEMIPDKFKNDNIDEDAIYEKHKVVFPDNIKVRHPLLGMEWKAQIDLANEAIIKEYSSKRHKTKKYKSVKTKEAEIVHLKRENSNSNIFVQKKKRKKSKDD